MYFGNYLLTITQPEKELIHANVLRILGNIGVLVESDSILRRLSDFGAQVDAKSQTAKFPPAIIEDFLENSIRFDWNAKKPWLNCLSGVFYGKYLNPETNRLEDWDEKKLASYVKVAKAMPNVKNTRMLCCPLNSVPGEIHTLYSKYLNWKLGMAAINYSILDIDMCPFIEEFHHLRAQTLGMNIKDSILGGVFLITPLKFPRTEAEQFLYFAERGYPCFIDHMMSIGGSGPVTIAGAAALAIAEGIFISVVQFLYYSKREISFGCSISPLDMKSGGFCYGRPEMVLANHILGQMAEYYHADFTGGQSGLTDASMPGAEAGAQKVLTALPSLLIFKSAKIVSGTLSADRVNSPVQLIHDNEVAGALIRLALGTAVTQETLAFDTIAEVGHSGFFTDKEHTVANFRNEIWDSKLWSSLDGWLSPQGATAEERAMEKWREIMAQPDPPPAISDDTESKIKDIMQRALEFKKK